MKKNVVFFLFLLVLFSCRKVIDLPISEGPKIDVIEACVYDTVAFVRISKSVKEVYSVIDPEIIKGAQVYIDVDGVTYNLKYEENVNVDYLILGGTNAIKKGYYLDNIPKGNIYKLKIQTPEGNIYSAEQKSFKAPIINTAKLKYRKLFNRDFYNAELDISEVPDDFEVLKVFFNYPSKKEEEKNWYDYYSYGNFGENVQPFSVGLNNIYFPEQSIGKDSSQYPVINIICSYTTKEIKKFGDHVLDLDQGPPSSIRVPVDPSSNIKVEKGGNIVGYFAVYNFSEKVTPVWDSKSEYKNK